MKNETLEDVTLMEFLLRDYTITLLCTYYHL